MAGQKRCPPSHLEPALEVEGGRGPQVQVLLRHVLGLVHLLELLDRVTSVRHLALKLSRALLELLLAPRDDRVACRAGRLGVAPKVEVRAPEKCPPSSVYLAKPLGRSARRSAPLEQRLLGALRAHEHLRQPRLAVVLRLALGLDCLVVVLHV